MSKTAIDLYSHYYPKPLVKKLMDYGILNEERVILTWSSRKCLYRKISYNYL
ncbi:hypothetical protein [Acidianus infernus]|uniref:hypothetical protein n=1 Tax=Acidianus infernus TaxID=12915 RepID=UPI0012DD4DB5|nr:hypothetical protein [Acidianus infernus]